MAALDQMDFLMHQPDTGTGPVPGPGFYALQHQGRCPFFHGEQAAGHRGSSLPAHSDFHNAHAGPPLGLQQQQQQQQPSQQPQHHRRHQQQQSHQLPPPQPSSDSAPPRQGGGLHPQSCPSSDGNHSHPRSQARLQPQSQAEPQTHFQPQLPPPQQQPILPHPHEHPHQHLHQHPHQHPHLIPLLLPLPHSHHPPPYDPVHSASPAWFQDPSWPTQTGHLHHSSTPTHASHARPPAVNSPFGSVPISTAGPPAGALHPPVPSHPPTSSHPDFYAPFGFQGYLRPAAYPRNPLGFTGASQLSSSSPQSGQSDENLPGQPGHVNRSSQATHEMDPPETPPTSRSTPGAMGDEQGPPPLAGPGGTAGPSENAASNNLDQGSARLQFAAHSMTDSRRPSPPAVAGPPGRSAIRFRGDLPGPSNRGAAPVPLQALGSAAHIPPDPSPQAYQFRPMGSSAINIPTTPVSDWRRHNPGRPRPRDPHASDDEPGSSDEEEEALRYIREFGSVHSHFRSLVSDDHVRAAQIIRGQVSNRRVASKQALSQLQSVDVESLPKSERTCVICYNDYGQPSPEGVVESPLRLPRCQHVFGDHCIRKWFEESDSCPYCRDKLPSEPAVSPGFRAIQNLLRSRARSSAGNTLTFPGDDALFRFIAQQEHRALGRYRNRQDVLSENSSPTSRPFQPRERRSPPSEASENRRRTRPRHGNLQRPLSPGSSADASASRITAAAYAANPPGLLPQGQLRDRVITPSVLPWPGLPAQDSNRSLTAHLGGQAVGANLRPLYPPGNPGYSFGGTIGGEQQMALPNAGGSSAFSAGNAAPAPTLPLSGAGYYPGMMSFTGSTGITQLPPLGSFEAPAFPGVPNSGSGGGGHGAGSAPDQMQ